MPILQRIAQQHEEAKLRTAAARALGYVAQPDDKGVRTLLEHWQADPNAEVSKAAREALNRLDTLAEGEE